MNEQMLSKLKASLSFFKAQLRSVRNYLHSSASCAPHQNEIKRWVKLAVILVALGTGIGLVGNAALLISTRKYIFTTPESTPARSVAIVPGARVFEDGTPSRILADRLLSAAALYHQGRVRKIIVSGDHKAPAYNEVNAMYRFLVGQGVQSPDIFLDHAGLRTLDTMARASKIFGVQNAIICTQRFHLPRAVFLARANDIDAVGLCSDRVRYRSHFSNMAREFIARTVGLMDVFALGTGPRHLGPSISMQQSGHVTHDTHDSIIR